MFKISKAQIAHLIAAPIVLGITIGSAQLVKLGGPSISPEFATAVGSGIGLAAAGYALHYLKGLREWERLEGEGVIVVEDEGVEKAQAAEAIPTAPTRTQADEALAALPAGDLIPVDDGGAPGGGE